MYADEVLFQAGINPFRSASSLSLEEIKLLHRSIRSVLDRAIERKGATVSDYTRPGGEAGRGAGRLLCCAPARLQLSLLWQSG
jgi:formamidopyrimidine-DNA glycosylase